MMAIMVKKGVGQGGGVNGNLDIYYASFNTKIGKFRISEKIKKKINSKSGSRYKSALYVSRKEYNNKL